MDFHTDSQSCLRSRLASGVLLLGWSACLVASLLFLIRAGHGPLAVPPLSGLAKLQAWASSRGPFLQAMTLIRLVALMTTVILLAGTAAGVAKAFMALNPAVHHQNLFSRRRFMHLALPLATRLAQRTLGVAILSAAILPTRLPDAMATDYHAATSTVTMVRLPSLPPASTPPPRVDHRAPTATVATGSVPARPDPGPARPGVPCSSASWTITSGDNLWAVADETLRARWGRIPADQEVDDYWRRLIQENLDRLVHPGQPDLVYPGQVFRLP
ncbi:MAG: LysM peptidoglycan-binding domain-containing protein [Acidimicrobiales bacterium]